MSKVCLYVDYCIANEEDAKDVFGIEADNTDINTGSVIYTAVEKAGEKISCDPTVLTADETCTYKRTQEIMRYSNEISRLTASPNPSFKAGKKLILECASLKFQACRENKGVSYTNRILQLTKNKKYGIDYISDVVSKIIIEKDGTVIVAMINGAKIGSKEVDNAGTSEKSCNEDRRQSNSCEAK
jgi:KHG/KDPG family aldolase/carbohydrate kinase, pfkB family